MIKNIILFLIFLLNGFASYGQNREVIDDLKKMIVKIDAIKEPSTGYETGAGMVIGVEGPDVYILTAYHVVGFEDNLAKKIEIRFPDFPNISFDAQIIRENNALDIAVLKVLRPNFDFKTVHFISDFTKIQPETKTITIGHPGNIGNWHLSKGEIREIDEGIPTYIFKFKDDDVYPGSSGGAVFSERGEWIGLVLRTNGVRTTCIKSERIINELKEWGILFKEILKESGCTNPEISNINDQYHWKKDTLNLTWNPNQYKGEISLVLINNKGDSLYSKVSLDTNIGEYPLIIKDHFAKFPGIVSSKDPVYSIGLVDNESNCSFVNTEQFGIKNPSKIWKTISIPAILSGGLVFYILKPLPKPFKKE